MNQKSRKKITEKMTIAEVLEKYPQTSEILHKHLGFCTTCPAASMETLALGAHLHQKDVNKIAKELNDFVEKNGNKKTK